MFLAASRKNLETLILLALNMDNLYNAQDVILLCGIIEHRFELMLDKYGFNPRKCNSASTFSGSLERERSF